MSGKGIYDIHCHIVPGVDDGATDIEETGKLLRMEYEQGVRTIIATPHFRFRMFETSAEKVKEQFKLVEKAAAEVASDLHVYLGCEFHTNMEMISMLRENKVMTVKIVEVNAYHVRPRWGFVEIITDEGITGWGEAVLEGHCDAVLACVQEYRSYLIGQDPFRIEDISATIFRAGFYRGGGVLMSALSGIDQALWDIKGKAFGAPAYELMGGKCRDKIKVYSWIGGDRPSDVGTAAKERQNAGFKAIKMNATEELQMIDSYDKIDAVLERVAAIRESCGKYFGIAIDFHGRVHKPMAKILAKKLEEFDPMFIEEPVLCENMEVFKEIAVACNIPIATGERLFTKYDFKRLLQVGGVDIIQPDLSHAGGLTEVKKIASMAEAYDVALAPHCPLGPIALAACLNVDATCYNAVIQEQSIGIHYNVGKSVLDYALNKQDFQFVDGFCAMPTKPGLGVEVNKELVLEENLTKHQWKNPIWRHVDGSVAEW